MNFWSYYFAWYTGNVYGNLIASALCTGLAAAIAVLKIGRNLRRLGEREQAARKAHHQAIRDTLAEHHEAFAAQLAPIHEHLGTTPPDGGRR